MDKHLVRVDETRNVSELKIENLSGDLHVFIQADDIVSSPATGASLLRREKKTTRCRIWLIDYRASTMSYVTGAVGESGRLRLCQSTGVTANRFVVPVPH